MCLCVFIHIFKPLIESGEAHVRTELLEKDLYKNPAGWCCGLLAHPDALQHLVEKCYGWQKEEQGLDNWDTLCIKLRLNQIGMIPFLHSRAQSLCTVGEQTVVPHSWVCWSPVCELYRTALQIWPQNSPCTPSSADRTSKDTKIYHEELFLHVTKASIHTPYTNINTPPQDPTNKCALRYTTHHWSVLPPVGRTRWCSLCNTGKLLWVLNSFVSNILNADGWMVIPWTNPVWTPPNEVHVTLKRYVYILYCRGHQHGASGHQVARRPVLKIAQVRCV